MPFFVTTFTHRSAVAATAATISRTEEADDLRHAIRKTEQALGHEYVYPLSRTEEVGLPILSANVIAVKIAAPAPSKANLRDRPDVKAVAEAVGNYNDRFQQPRRSSF